MPFGLLHTILACNSLLPYTIATLGTNSTGLLHQCNDDEWKWHSEFWQSIDIHGIHIIFSPGCTDATCGGNTASRFSMPLTSLGEKKYYLGIFFKVQNIPKNVQKGSISTFRRPTGTKQSSIAGSMGCTLPGQFLWWIVFNLCNQSCNPVFILLLRFNTGGVFWKQA